MLQSDASVSRNDVSDDSASLDFVPAVTCCDPDPDPDPDPMAHLAPASPPSR